jgi:pyruvate ferredoxin oxidoreductase gamma subunit
VAFCRLDDREIRLREPVTDPDTVIVQDATLLHQVAVFDGLRKDGYLLVNSAKSWAELGLAGLAADLTPQRAAVVPATQFALREIGRPVPNAALLGGFAALTGQVSIDSVVAAIRERFSGAVADGNEAAARAAHDEVRAQCAAPANTGGSHGA